MKVVMTFKLVAESRQELIDTMGGYYRELRAYVEAAQADGRLPQGDVRWLLTSGGYTPKDEQAGG